MDRSVYIRKQLLKDTLRNLISKVHFTVDLWTSPNRLALFAINAHFVSKEYKLKKVLLALPCMHESHGGELQAKHVFEVIKEYDIAHKVSCFTSDNHGSNDKLLRILSQHLDEEFNLYYDPIKHRLRCQAHVVNLVVQAFLFSQNPEAADKAIRQAEADEKQELDEVHTKDLKHVDKGGWRRQGALGSPPTSLRPEAVFDKELAQELARTWAHNYEEALER